MAEGVQNGLVPGDLGGGCALAKAHGKSRGREGRSSAEECRDEDGCAGHHLSQKCLYKLGRWRTIKGRKQNFLFKSMAFHMSLNWYSCEHSIHGWIHSLTMLSVSTVPY